MSDGAGSWSPVPEQDALPDNLRTMDNLTNRMAMATNMLPDAECARIAGWLVMRRSSR